MEIFSINLRSIVTKGSLVLVTIQQRKKKFEGKTNQNKN